MQTPALNFVLVEYHQIFLNLLALKFPDRAAETSAAPWRRARKLVALYWLQQRLRNHACSIFGEAAARKSESLLGAIDGTQKKQRIDS
jgi:hypothetical protein